MQVLAIADGWVIGMSAANMLISIGMGFGLFLLNRRARRSEGFEAEQRQEMQTLKSELKSTAGALVEEKIGAKTAALASAMEHLAGEIGRINQRLTEGEGRFDRLGERDRSVELALANQTGELQKWMLEKFATKNDVALVHDKIDGLGDRVAQLAAEQARAQGLAEGAARKGSSKTA